ncbi:nuclease-related domain-containing protein [Jeotgalibacillus malaysiensis]|uniref:nuclease-related domain-containing protein n=1 Tax=Jeotgalibacillus malaysiensis TaxID=1508404 RepID=UPI00384EAE84
MLHSVEEVQHNTLNLRIENRTVDHLDLSDRLHEDLYIDKMVITTGGIFVIQYNEARGMIDGNHNRPIWLSDGDIRMKNPLQENQKKIQSLKQFIPPYFHDYFYSIIGFKKRVKINVPGNHKDIEGQEWLLAEGEISEYIERVILKKNVMQDQPIKMHHLNILERGLRWMAE